MIERLQLIASFLGRLIPLIVVLAVCCAVLFAYSLFQFRGQNNTFMLPALAGFCWLLLLYSYARLFARIPEKPGPGQGFFRRLSLRFRRALMTVLALLMLLLGLAVLVLSYQLVRTWLM